MKQLIALALVGFALVGGAIPALADCEFSTTATWDAKPGLPLRVEARSHGETCSGAEVTLAIFNRGGDILWSDSAPAEHVMIFSGIKTQKAMERALKDWIGAKQQFATTGDLPEWKVGDAQPAQGEFPFYPEPAIDRITYEDLRAAKLPVFSYVQGMESLAVIILQDDGQMEKLGAQSFPG